MPLLTARFEDALLLAARHHADQVRKGTKIPYLAHLLSVAALALEHGATEDEAIAALLHDAVEDGGGPEMLAGIRERFGDTVAEIVDGCTDADTIPKPPWRARKEAYIARMAVARAPVRLVSSADKLHNARAILADVRATGDEVWSRFTAPRDQVIWYYRSLVAAYRAAGGTPVLDELDRTVTEIERLAGEKPAGVHESAFRG